MFEWGTKEPTIIILVMIITNKVVTLDMDGGSKLRFIAIQSLSGWMVVKAECVPVGQYLRWCVAAGIRGMPHCLVFTRTRERDKSLLKLAAESAFSGLLLPHLRKLYNELGVVLSRKPQTERMFADALVRHALADLPEDEYKRILKLRFEPEPVAARSLLEDEDNMGIAQDMFDEAEAKHVVEPAVHKLKASRSKTGPSGDVARGGGASSSSGSAGQSRQRLPNPDASGEYTVEEVRAMLPEWHPTAVSRERLWHSRWRVSCPDKRKSSSTFGPKRTEREAVANVVQFVWHRYSLTPNAAACPWIFDSVPPSHTSCMPTEAGSQRTLRV